MGEAKFVICLIKVDSFLFKKVIALNRIQMESAGTGQEAAQVEDSAGAFQPVKSRKRKSKEIHMETVADPLPETVPETVSEEVPTKRPHFPPIAPEALENTVDSLRKIPVPNNRYTHLKLQVRFNLQTRNVEIKTCEETKNIGAIQKAATSSAPSSWASTSPTPWLWCASTTFSS